MPPSSIQDPNAPRSSTSSGSGSTADQTRSIRSRTLSKDDISKGPALSISQLPPDSHNAKLFQAPGLPADAQSGQPHLTDSQIIARKMLDHRGPSLDVPLSSSLPSNMDNPGSHDRSSHHLPSQRSNSELGHYSDMQYPHQQSSKGMKGAFNRSSFHPTSLGTIKSNSPTHDHTSPEHGHPHKVSITKISAPTNGVVIPEGYKFGAKEPSPGDQAANERERKAKSKGFWAFGRQCTFHSLDYYLVSSNFGLTAHAPANAPGSPPRAVFGVTIQDSLAVAQIANLPAIVFRCIQYLETKHAEQEEGIYRLSGSSAVIKALKDRFNAGACRRKCSLITI
jgi:RalA-binding protein 1